MLSAWRHALVDITGLFLATCPSCSMYFKDTAPAWPKAPFINIVLPASLSLRRYKSFLHMPGILFKYLCNGTYIASALSRRKIWTVQDGQTIHALSAVLID
ncbi:hypothetical protein LX36DRAFT_484909 [Colletotrichum falcatum]|nr:hypothetical protein LX36DRAFT_484909 [Colletotrichum falcatum]